jgi:hypothetical protein
VASRGQGICSPPPPTDSCHYHRLGEFLEMTLSLITLVSRSWKSLHITFADKRKIFEVAVLVHVNVE